MKTRIIYLLIIISALLAACSLLKKKPTDNKIVVGTTENLFSKILKEERKIWVHLLETDALYAKQSYPVVYLLDGDAHFYSVMGMIQQLSEVNMNRVFPEMIIIGISNTDRTRDFTPTSDSLDYGNSGEGERFTAFLQKELIPYVDSLYPTKPYRILIGHSDGGLFCINTLMNHTKLFNGYIAIDPSLYWDNKKLLKQSKKLLAQNDFTGTSFYLSIANQGYSDTDSIKDNASAFELAKYMDSVKNKTLTYRWHYYEDDNHGSVPFISEYDGLRFILDFYNPRLPYTKFRDPSYNVDSFMVTHFANVSKQMGYTVPPPESLMNWLAYLFIMEKQYDKAYKLMKINIENFPESFNTYDSMGELLILKGDTVEAINNFEKSLKYNPDNQNAKNMIKKLKK